MPLGPNHTRQIGRCSGRLSAALGRHNVKAKYAVFATVDGQVKFLEEASVRFSRANWKASKLAKIYPGVFFSHVWGQEPHGERHKPSFSGMDVPEAKRREAAEKARQDRNRETLVSQTKPSYEDVLAFERHRRPRRKIMGKTLENADWTKPDPTSGESLNDIAVDLIRRQAGRDQK